MYSPKEFGFYGFSYSLGAILGIFSTLRYENSIIISETIEETFRAERLCEVLTSGVNLTVAFTIICYQILDYYFIGSNESYLRYLTIPLWGWSIAFFRIKTLVANSKEKFKLVSKIRVIQGAFIVILSILFGLVKLEFNGMVWAHVIGNLIGVVLLHQRNSKVISTTPKELILLAKRYSNFLRFSLLAEMVSNISMRYPLIVFPFLFGNEITGYLTLAYRVVGLPASLIAKAISEVFFQKASQEIKRKGSCQQLFFFTTLLTASISVTSFLVLYFVIDTVFDMFFEPKWFVTSVLIKILIPLSLSELIVSPISTIIFVLEAQFLDLLWKVFQLFMLTIFTFVGWFYFGTPQEALRFLVLGGVISAIVYYCLLYALTKKGKIDLRSRRPLRS